MPVDRAQELSNRFNLIDTNKNGQLEVSELQAVFGEHSSEFLQFCDGDGDKQLTCEEFVNGITKDCEDMDDADFQTNWLDRMSEAIAAAKPAAGGDAAITKEGVMAVIAAATEDTNAVKMEYGSKSVLSSGLCTDVELPGGFKFKVDEPEMMPGGTNQGPNPLDVMCGAFGTCQEITYKMYATVMEIPLKSVSCSVKAPIDLRGLVGLADDKVGFSKLDAEIKIDAEASDEQLAALKAAVDAHCPMVATLARKVEVSTTIKSVNSEQAPSADDPVKQEAVLGLIGAAKEDESALQFTYSSESQLNGVGLDTKLTMPLGHSMVIDEPASMPGGNNKGPNPLDLLCSAFGTCQEITYKLYATVMGIQLNSVSAAVKAPIDLRGLLGLAEPSEVGFNTLSAEITIDSPASEEQLAGLKAAVDAHCPMVDTLAKELPVAVTLTRV